MFENPQETTRVDRSEESSLIRRLVLKEEAAWELFCRLYLPPLSAFLRYALGLDVERAEDVVQLTFLRCVRSIGTFDAGRGDLLNWLKSVARNECRTLFQQANRSESALSFSASSPLVRDEVLDLMDRDDLPEEILAQRDLQLLVHETLLRLGERNRMVLVMKYIEDMKVAEIGTRLEVSDKAVESLLSRARDAFRAAFLTRVSGRDAVGEYVG